MTAFSNKEYEYNPEQEHNKEVVAAYHEFMMQYDYELFSIEDEEELAEVERKLIAFIVEESGYLEPYLNLLGIYGTQNEQEKYDLLLEQTYLVALRHIKDKSGAWPKLIEWAWLENRCIIRALQNGAIKRWKEGKTEEAKQVLQNLLKVNPRDNSSVRYHLLAVLEGMSVEAFDKKIGDTGLIPPSIPKWFIKKAKAHKEFDEWLALEFE